MDALDQINEFKRIIESHYVAEFLENLRKGKLFLNLDFRTICKESHELAESLLDTPEDTIKAAEMACASLTDEDQDISVRLINVPKSERVKIRDIRSKHMGKLLYIEGVIKSRTDVRPQVASSRYECPSCGNVIALLQLDPQLKEPSKCGCGRKGAFRLLSRELIDVMSLTIEEDVSEIDDDSTPKKFRVLLKKDLTDKERVIDLIPPRSVRLTGQIMEVPINLKNGKKSTNLDIYLEANNFELIEDTLQRIVFTPEDIQQFKIFSKDSSLLEKLKHSVAPHLAGYEKIKEALLLFIAKGVAKKSVDKTIRSRDFFHILLIGDPGSGKSEFGKEVNNLSYKSKKAVGKGASGVGLTASAEKDDLLGERVLSAGTVPTCNGGHVVIDEVDKMDDEVQSHLLDCMENGEINISKSRVQGRLKANVGIFMIANPKMGRFSKYDPLPKQIQLSQPLISRFDLIFPILDIPDPEKDEILIDKILSKHENIEQLTDRQIDFTLMRKYLCYVSKHIKPIMSPEAKSVIKEYCKGMRNNSNGNSNTISITARQIESLVRLSEAYAKLKMRKKITDKDATNAIQMAEYYLRQLAYDEDTHKIDIDKIVTGISAKERNFIHELKIIIQELEDKEKGKVLIEDVVVNAAAKDIPEDKIESLIEKLKMDGDILEPRRGYIQRL